MALSGPRRYGTKVGPSHQPAYPVAASTKLWAGGLACLNASGYLVPAADTAGLTFVGLCLETVDNTSGANGDLYAKVEAGSWFDIPKSGTVVQADCGRTLFAVHDGAAGLYAAATQVPIGILEAIEGTNLWVKPLVPSAPGLRYVVGKGAFTTTGTSVAVSAKGLTKVYGGFLAPVIDAGAAAANGQLGFTEDASTGFPEVSSGNVTVNRIAGTDSGLKFNYVLFGE